MGAHCKNANLKKKESWVRTFLNDDFFSFFNDGPFPASFSLFSSFLINYNWQIKLSRCWDSNCGYLVPEATTLPTQPPPLPHLFIFLFSHWSSFQLSAQEIQLLLSAFDCYRFLANHHFTTTLFVCGKADRMNHCSFKNNNLSF